MAEEKTEDTKKNTTDGDNVDTPTTTTATEVKKEQPVTKDDDDKKEKSSSTTDMDVDEKTKNVKKDEGNDSTTDDKSIKKEDGTTTPSKTTDTPTTDADTIRKLADRLIFFFSDANLRYDRFMRQNLVDTSNRMLLSTLLKFNSIKSISSCPKAIVNAITTHCGSTLELSDDQTAVGRKCPFDYETAKGKNVDLSLYVEGLPRKENGGGYDVPFETVYKLFGRYGTVAMVRYRYDRYQSKEERKKFKSGKPLGSAFVEFSTKEELDKAVADLCGDDCTKLEVKGKTLSITTMRKWVDEKEQRNDNENDNNGSTNNNDNDDKDTTSDTKNNNNNDDPALLKKVQVDWKKGCVIRIKGLPPTCSRESILAAISSYTESLPTPPYVDYSRGQSSGAVRFKEPEEFIPELTKKLKAGELTISVEEGGETTSVKVEDAQVLEGEEEDTYWKEFHDFKKKQMKQWAMRDASKKRQRRSNDRGGWRGKKKGRR